MTTSNDYSLLLPCLARQILTDYPGQTKQKFYDLWLKHHDQSSLDHLKSLVSLEMSNFLGWCALHGLPASHSIFKDYSASNPVRILTNDNLIEPPKPVPVPPWWSELPWLRPAGAAL